MSFTGLFYLTKDIEMQLQFNLFHLPVIILSIVLIKDMINGDYSDMSSGELIKHLLELSIIVSTLSLAYIGANSL